ncbi:hypothetical protein Agub_g342 [Astrephomene gubernaculifera]|uniref:adenylate kinase n=1 Tax=Astrephomene gubernaculifera TaxID=47775 RepID=A0AAD3HGL7_9CHLO|nr:hypothetical protein Agub_g342 [Astrephomene gubernaculifera]
MGCGASKADQPSKPELGSSVQESPQDFALPPVKGSLPDDAQIVFVLGGPGSGKGTQCDKIKEQYDCVHLSAGDLLRAEVKSGSDVGQKCEALMRDGKLVPVAVTLHLLTKAMIESGGRFFLIDGFPRALDQAEAFEKAIKPCKAVLFFDCPEEEMEKRLLKRGETSGRSDDNADTIRKRFKTFVEQSLPVKTHYMSQNKCYVISAVPPPDEVYEAVKWALGEIGAPKKAGSSAKTEAPAPVDAPAAAQPTAVGPAAVEPAAVEPAAAEPAAVEPTAAEPAVEAEPIAVEPKAAPEPTAAADTATAPAVAQEVFALPEVPGSLPEDTQIVFVLGGPGSGKGTQCDQIKEEYECVHLSAGDLLRAEVKSGSEVGQKCEALMRDGKLVPVAVTLNLLKKAMIESGGRFFLIDGFPRALDQAAQFEGAIMPCKAVLFFDCPEEEMEKRLLKRGETSGRSDDNAETIRKRFRTFLEQSLPVKDHYIAQNKCAVISAVPPPKEVYQVVKGVLDSLGAPKKPEVFALPEVPGSLPEDTQIVFVLGGPGSGKGTQCDKMKEEYECVHLSAGDLLRAEVKSGSEVGQKCEALMRDGKLVPVAVTLNLLKQAMIESGGRFFLIDGFPRALDQAAQFEGAIMPCKAVLFFDCPEEEMEKRLLKRGETSGRSDDNAETIRKRFRTFLEQSLPVKDHYIAQNKCAVISAVPPPKEVYQVVKGVLDSLGAPKKPEVIALPEVPGSLPDDTQIVFVLGGPGSGKGTQCDKMKEEYECVHLSAGDLLRAEVKSGSEVGQKCEALMREGKLVPVAVTLNLLKKAMIESGGSFFLIDGFPRALDQAAQFEGAIMPCKMVLFFDCPEEEMEKRLLKRGETSGRSDDNAETIRKRFRTFLEQSLPVKDHYIERNKCAVISAVPTPDEVYETVKSVLDSISAPKK